MTRAREDGEMLIVFTALRNDLICVRDSLVVFQSS